MKNVVIGRKKKPTTENYRVAKTCVDYICSDVFLKKSKVRGELCAMNQTGLDFHFQNIFIIAHETRTVKS
jgi:hypothetical protein